MNLQQLNPWNWFKHEDTSNNLPDKYREDDRSTKERSNHPVLQLHQEIDQLFNEIFRGYGFPWGRARRPANRLAEAAGFHAKVNIASDEQNYHISLEVPGLSEDDISLDLQQGTLVIRGEKKQENETKDRHYYCVERSYGSFQRVLALPEDADQDKISATIKNGVLDISLPRKALPASESKRIAINS